MGVDVTGEKERPDLKVGDEKERRDVEKWREMYVHE